jgi:hypothetical protein
MFGTSSANLESYRYIIRYGDLNLIFKNSAKLVISKYSLYKEFEFEVEFEFYENYCLER